MKNILKDWTSAAQSIARASLIDLFLDFDGTIAPISSTPSAVRLPRHAHNLLRLLHNTGECRIGIISGRPLQELIQTVKLEGLYYAGNHGFEIVGPRFKFAYPLTKKQSKTLESITKQLRNSLEGFEGSLIEDKRYTLSVHYRLVSLQNKRQLASLVENCVRNYENIRLTNGKMVLEIRPDVDWNKGKAVDLIRKNFQSQGLSIYVGDDETDEDAFRMLADGITVRVG
ncbi:MAG: trehalose-phosphatase, partial [Thaumarchaeota archaeon]|nr:trehalose-phosphatase [Nitrososphaerota archaeon]